MHRLEGIGFAGLILAALLACKSSDDRTKERLQSAAAPAQPTAPIPVLSAQPSKAPERESRCVASIKGSDDMILLFPTEEGLDEFTSAAVRSDEEGMVAARRANQGFLVEKGTRCTWLDVGFAVTKVRITSGPHSGKAGFAPTEWVRND